MSQIKLEKLTSEQKALISVYQQKWRSIALSTEPINRPKASEAIKAAYTFIAEKEPEILFFDSPYLASKELEDLSFTQLDNDDLIYKLRVIPSNCDEELPPHQWCSQWLLSETNAELRRVLIEGMSAKISGE